ncbi:MAG: DsbE family thiol:disulfide interchange protein [Gammaproteobacteria bacterium]|nr:DsbE family thiol:disulfide interchange protein [Gammaproteobacteria bacterium]MBQ0838989.1 DsbE family thiol:disulfide interchange protein [Gammaproteobacteria bacterium]
MERIKLFIPLIIFVVLAAMLYWGLGRDPNAMPSALISRPVPVFQLPALGGLNAGNTSAADNNATVADPGEVLDESIFLGQVSLLNVWATWCVSCRVEHPYLLDIAETGVRIIGLNYKDEVAAAQQWLAKYGDPYEQTIVDAKGALGLDLGVFGAPETYLVDHLGVIRYKHIGVVDDRVWRTSLQPRYQLLRDALPEADK